MPKSATNLHQILLDTVMKAPQSFFDGADTGVTLNRFSQDMELITSPLVTSFHISFSRKYIKTMVYLIPCHTERIYHRVTRCHC